MGKPKPYHNCMKETKHKLKLGDVRYIKLVVKQLPSEEDISNEDYDVELDIFGRPDIESSWMPPCILLTPEQVREEFNDEQV